MHRQDGWQQEIGVLYFENKQNRIDAYMTPGYTETQFCMTGMPLLFLVCKKSLILFTRIDCPLLSSASSSSQGGGSWWSGLMTLVAVTRWWRWSPAEWGTRSPREQQQSTPDTRHQTPVTSGAPQSRHLLSITSALPIEGKYKCNGSSHKQCPQCPQLWTVKESNR